ncbi:hypothetical protein V6M85_08600 [Sulfolobus tengchongensis]|uniref:Uncharacterized protein n=1 Tax=Sulfolobus tengchongensis TaxID=207809 RepID=A0AAX4KXF0_9CREN
MFVHYPFKAIFIHHTQLDPYEAMDPAGLVQVDYEPLEPIPNIGALKKEEKFTYLMN